MAKFIKIRKKFINNPLMTGENLETSPIIASNFEIFILDGDSSLCKFNNFVRFSESTEEGADNRPCLLIICCFNTSACDK